MKKIYLIAVAIFFIAQACKKEDKPYTGETQIAFENTTYAYKITKDTTVIVPIQLISTGPQSVLNASVVADSSAYGTVVLSNSLPADYKIDAGRFTTPVSVNISYAGFGTDTKKVLRLTLTSNSCKVASNYKVALLSISK